MKLFLCMRVPTATLLVFLFIFLPFTPVFAQVLSEGGATSESAPSQNLDSVENVPAETSSNVVDLTNSDVPQEEVSSQSVESTEPVNEGIDEGAQMESLLWGGDEAPTQAVPSFTYQNLNPKVDKASGALVQTLPIAIPPGRNGLQPSVGLTYNSQRLEDGIVGYGWQINIPYIERINRRGTNNLYTDDYFYSSLSGELASTSVSGTYRAQVEEGAFLNYTLTTASASTTWTVYDKQGTRYTFGITAQARLDDSSSTTTVYRWMLEEVRDTNDNFVRYEYTKDQNQVYPYRIYYTGNGASDGLFQIEFTKVSRPDPIISYKTRFLVRTDYRISEIQAKVNGTWVRKYVLGYTTGNNGKRSLLASVKESAQVESGASSLSFASTTFEYASNTPNFNSAVDYSSGVTDISTPAYIPTDVDGNGTPDVSLSYYPPGEIAHNEIKLNILGSYITKQADAYFNDAWGSTDTPSMPRERGVRFLDFNGDGKADVLVSLNYPETSTSTKRLLINTSRYWDQTGTGDLSWSFATTAATTTIPFFGQSYFYNTYPYGVFGNLNSDGLPDFQVASTTTSVNRAYFSNGLTGFEAAATSTFSPKGAIPSQGQLDTQDNRLIDINGDGLDDWMKNDNGIHFYLNNGAGWNSSVDTNWDLATSSVDGNGQDKGVRFLDMNGDGLLDFVRSYKVDAYTSSAGGTYPPEIASIWLYRLNTGMGWATTTIPSVEPTHRIVYGTNSGSQWVGNWKWSEMVDGNGDGSVGDITVDGGQDMLIGVGYPTGASTTVAYTPTVQQERSWGSDTVPKHVNLPMSVFTVTGITNKDGLGVTQSTTYSYDGGSLYWNGPYDKKMAGFEVITETRPDAITKTYYHQGNTSSTTAGEFNDHVSKIGKPYREDVFDAEGTTLYKRTFYTYDKVDQGNTRNFVFLSTTTEQTYDGDSDHRDSAVSFFYATTTGNLVQKTQWGEVTGSSTVGVFTDTGSDKLITSYTHATGTNLSLLATETTVNQSGSTVSQSRKYYDSQSLGSVTDGNLTKLEQKINGSTYASTTRAYNAYGLVTSEYDPRAKVTTYTYDTYNLYPATTTNALSKSTGRTFDYSSGKVTSVYTPNLRSFVTVYDPFDRPTEEKQPDITTPTTLVTKATYTYTDNTIPTKVQQTLSLNSATSTDLFTYFDGFARKIQERAEAEGTNTYAVKDYVYNNKAQLWKESLPYFASSSAYAASTSVSTLYTTFTYDPLGRVTESINAIGSTATVFDQWYATTTDANGRSKDYEKDARGNLVRVNEYSGSEVYQTSYEYNGLNNLTKITDALGNVRNFTYDYLGRRLTAEDLHASADGTFGTWTYTYDLSGNTTQTVDSKSQTINYTYDSINRVLTEDYTGSAGTEVAYGYDSCADGVGQLCFATTTASTVAVTVNEYNALGGVKKETKKIGSDWFITQFEYDRLGNQTLITYPNSAQTAYTYNDAGQLEKTQYRNSSSSSYNALVLATNYSPLGQVTYQDFGNNTETCNTYDSTALYRLTNKRTTAFGYSCASIPNPTATTTTASTTVQFNLLQDITYTYDGVGNILSITEIAPVGTGRVVNYSYDYLNRMVSAVTEEADSHSYGEYYTYNAIGNILSKSDTASPLNTYAIDLETVSDQYASAGNISLGGSQTMTVEWWMKPESWNMSDATLIFGDNNGSSQMTVRGIWESSNLYVQIYDGVQLKSCYVPYSATGSWVHAAFVINTGASAGSRCVAYINGSVVSDTEDFAGNALSNSSANFIIGNDATLHTDRFFDGKIDDFRIWSDVRTGSEILSNYILELAGSEQGLIYNWKFDNSYTGAVAGNPTLSAVNSPVFDTDIPYGAGGDSTINQTYTYSGTGSTNPHAVTQIANGIATTSYAYDTNGNLTSAGTSTYSWSYSNRLTQAASNNSTSTYAYDHAMQRVQQAVALGTTTYPNNLFSRQTKGGISTTTVYVYAGGTLVAQIEKGGSTATTTSTIHPDHLSSTNVISDQASNLARSLDYYPFGSVRIDAANGITTNVSSTSSATSTNAYSLDLEVGSNHCVYAPDNGTLHPTGSMSFDLWVKPEHELTGSDFWGLIDAWYNGAYPGGAKRSFALSYAKSGGNNRLQLWTSPSGSNNKYVIVQSALELIPDGVWTRVSASYNSSNGAIKLYIDNVEQTPTFSDLGGGGNLFDNDFLTGIGCSYEDGVMVHQYDGLIDDVRMWNSVITDFSDEAELIGNEANLIGYWKMNNTYDDATSNNNDLSASNTPSFSTDVPFETGQEGGVSTSTDSYVYGTTTTASKKYIGLFQDAPTNLIYAKARYYEGSRGQFISQDPVFWEVGITADGKAVLRDPQLQNSYSYARDNPIINKDPDGRCPMCLLAIGGAGAGIVGQFGYDVYSNVQAGGWGSAFSNFSSGETYLTRATQGAILGATGGAVGTLTGVGLLGQSAIMGGASGLVGAGANAYLGESVTVQSVATDVIFGGATFGLAGAVPRVPGRLPNFGTSAFFTGKHTQQSAMQLGVGSISNYTNQAVGNFNFSGAQSAAKAMGIGNTGGGTFVGTYNFGPGIGTYDFGKGSWVSTAQSTPATIKK